MKLIVLLAVMAVAMSTKSYAQSVLPLDVDTDEKNIAVRANLNVGNPTTLDRQLYYRYTTRAPVYNVWQIEEFAFYGNATTRIAAVRVLEQGFTQYATPYIQSGGVGYNYVIIRIQSYISQGWSYVITVYGR